MGEQGLAPLRGSQQVYEYRTTRCHDSNDLDKHMNEMGADGWRVLQGPSHSSTMYPNSGMWTIRWERQRPSSPVPSEEQP